MARTLHTIVFRASMINDPEDTEGEGFIELELEVWEVTPGVLLIGGITTDAAGYKTTDRKMFRRMIQIEFLEFVKASDDVEFQDYALYSKLVEHVFTRRFAWIYRVYQSGDDHAGGPLPRADFNRNDHLDEESANSFWNASAATSDGYPYEPAGHLPMEIVSEDDIELPTHEGAGIYHLELTLAKAEIDLAPFYGEGG